MNVFDLQAKISLDSAKFEKGLSAAKSKIGTFAKVGIGAIVGGATLMAGGFVKAAKSTADYGDHVDKMSQKIGISAESYQKWDYVMQRAGGSVDSLKMGMKTLSQQAEKNSDAFQKLGISQEEVANSSQEELFNKTIKGLAGMEAGTERAALASELLGRAGADLGPLLNQGSDAIEDQMKIAEKYGMVMPDAAVKASAAFKDSLTTLQMTFTGLRNRLMGEFLPSLTQVTDGLALVFAGDYDKGIKKIDEGINEFVNNMSKVLPKVLEIGGKIVGSLGKAIIQNLPQLISAGTEMIITLITALIDNLPLLMDSAVQIVIALAEGIANGMPKIIKAIENGLPKIVAAGKKIFTQLKKGLSEKAPSLIKSGAEWVVNILKGIIEKIPEIVNGATSLVESFVGYLTENLPKFVETAGEMIKSLAKGLVENLPAIIESLAELARTIFESLDELIPLLLEAGLNLISSLAQGILEGVASLLGPAAEGITTAVSEKIDALKTYLSNTWETIKSTASTAWETIKTVISAPIEFLVGFLSGLWDSMKTAATKMWDGLKQTASTTWDGIKTAISTPIDLLKTALSKAWDAIKTTASGAWDAIKEAILGPFQSAYETISGIVSDIKGLFPVSLGKLFSGTLTTIKAKITDAANEKTVSYTTGVQQFAKAMNQPYMFTKPTFFDYDKIAGEAGDEILYGRNSLMRDIREAVGGANGNTYTFNVYATPNQSPKEIANAVQKILIQEEKHRRSAWA